MVDRDLEAELAEIVTDLEEEVQLWQEECGGMPGQIISFDMFMAHEYLHSLATFLIEKGVIDDAELTVWFKRHQLESMREHRKLFKRARQEELLKELQVPMMGIPRGKPRF